MKKNNVGRPTAMTEEVLLKLEEAFCMGCTDKEACFFADIATSTLYEYCKDNKDFSERKEALKQNPILKARKTIIDDLEDPQTAKWYLERKLKNEFSTKVLQEHEGVIGSYEVDSETAEELIEKIRKNAYGDE